MKKALMSMAVGVILASGAAADSGINTDDGSGFTIATGVKASKSLTSVKVYKIQPLTEIVGEEGHEKFLEVGMRFDRTKVGVRYSSIADVDGKKIEGTLNFDMFSLGIANFTFNSAIGIGEQKDSFRTLSTNAGTINYIVGGAELGKNTKVKVSDVSHFSLTAGTGVEIPITKNLRLSAGYELESRWWGLSYKQTEETDQASMAYNHLGGVKELYHGVRATVEYRF
jgi:opacity protein-like surface antigen